MEADYGWLSRRSLPTASSSQTPPPLDSPTVTLPFPWRDDNPFVACNPNADYFPETSSFLNPNYYSTEALASAFSGLGVSNGNVRRSPYNLDAAATAGVIAIRRQLEGLQTRGAIMYSDPDSSLFDSSRSELPRNVADQGPDSYFSANRSIDLYGSSSSSPLPGNLMSRASVCSRSTTFLGGEMANGGLCGAIDYTCLYDFPPFQSYHHHQQQQQLDFNVLIDARTRLNGFKDNGVTNRRNSRPNLEIDTGLINLMDLRGRLASQATDNYDSRILHAMIQEAKKEEIDMVFSEVIDDALDLMTHVCGYYFMQKLIDVCGEEQRSRLLLSVIKDSRQLKFICCSNHGTRCIQSLLEKLESPELISKFILAIRPGVVDLIKDTNGYHVIRYCLDNFSPQQNKYILKVVVENCFDIARHISGCRVINQCIDKSEGEDRVRLLSDIIENAFPLAEDCYGNYVVQHVLDMNCAQLNSKIWKKLRGCFASLSYNKFGSHVVEKLLTANDIYQSCIINELLQSEMLLVDKYGNYVIQAALRVAQGDTLRALFAVIEKNTPLIRFNRYGKKVIEAYERKKVFSCISMYDLQSMWMRELGAGAIPCTP